MDFFENILGKDVYIPLDNGGARGKLEEKENFEFLCMKEYRDIKLEVLESRRLRRFSLVSWRIFFENILGKGYIPLDDGRVLCKNEYRNTKLEVLFWKSLITSLFSDKCANIEYKKQNWLIKGFLRGKKIRLENRDQKIKREKGKFEWFEFSLYKCIRMYQNWKFLKIRLFPLTSWLLKLDLFENIL